MQIGASFRAVPLVLGCLGPRAAASIGPAGPGSIVHSGPGWAARVSGDLLPGAVDTGPGWLTWGRYVTDRRTPRDWREASHDLGLSGIWSAGETVRVHGDVFGVQAVYTRDHDGATWFSNRVAPLRDLGGPLTEDVDAWGDSLAFAGMIAEATGFAEIRRLRAAECLVADGNQVRRMREPPAWAGQDGPAAGRAEVIEALREVLPRRWPRRRTAITLSGGWDSRLIALGLAANGARRPHAWTVHPDTPYDDDLAHAVAAARALKLEQTVVGTHRDAWLRRRSGVLTRFEHENWLHTWMEPMARRVRAGGHPVFDGLGGDVILRNLLGGPGLLNGDHEARLRAHWEVLGTARLHAPDGLQPAWADRWAETSFDRVVRAGDLWAGHPAEFTLRSLTARTARAIGLAPQRLYAPEVPVVLPFIDPRFAQVALRVPVATRDDHSFYRSLLTALDPVAGALRSTNDGLQLPSDRPPRQGTRSAVAAMAHAILADEHVTSILHPTLVARLLEERRYLRQLRGRLPILQWAASYADWRRENASAIGS